MKKIECILKLWREKLDLRKVNFDEILLYANNCNDLCNKVGRMIASELIFDSQKVESLKESFCILFDELNFRLIKYIPHQPDGKWCSFVSLLEDYNVSLPQKLQNFISTKIWFPGYESNIPKDQIGNHPISSNLKCKFQLEVSLKLEKNITLSELSGIVSELEEFQKLFPEKLLNMFVFFKLQYSIMFDKYLRFYIKEIIKSQQECQENFHHISSFTTESFHSLATNDMPSDSKFSIDNLVKALESTSELLENIMLGTSPYSEIISEDKLTLDEFEIEKEFSILSEYIQVYNLSADHRDGLSGVRNIVELFQYTTYVENIESVCEQYHLSNCLKDPKFKALSDIMHEHVNKEDCDRITPIIASQQMKVVKELLCLKDNTSSKCLDIFAAMKESAAFFHFIRDKQFYGEKGQISFNQQCELITAQLQHEEYNESVLNHLIAAFKVITPFMDCSKNFTDLMKEVTALNAVNGLKQLETVNANITLIRLWFSRAEV